MEHVTCPNDNVLVFTTKLEGCDIKRVLIDSGTLTDVLFLTALKNIRNGEKDLKKGELPLMGFALTTTYVVGVITMLVYLGEG